MMAKDWIGCKVIGYYLRHDIIDLDMIEHDIKELIMMQNNMII